MDINEKIAARKRQLAIEAEKAVQAERAVKEEAERQLTEAKQEVESRTLNGKVYASIQEMEVEKERQSRTLDGVTYNEKNDYENAAKEREERTYKGVVYPTLEDANIERAKLDVGWKRIILILLTPLPSAFLLLLGNYRRNSRIAALVYMTIWTIAQLDQPSGRGFKTITSSIILGGLLCGWLLLSEYKSKKKVDFKLQK